MNHPTLHTCFIEAVKHPPLGSEVDLSCEQCGAAFKPRSSGGKKQRFCSPQCRMDYHANRDGLLEQRGQRATLGTLGEAIAGPAEPDKPLTERVEESAGLYGALCKRGINPSEIDMDRALADFKIIKGGKEPITDDEAVDNLTLHLLDKSPPTQKGEDFDWEGGDVVVHEQRRIAVYRNFEGDVVIRGKQDWPDEESDPYFIITAANLDRVINALKALR